MKKILTNILVSIVIISAPTATFAVGDDTSKTDRYDLPTYTVEDIAVLPIPTRNPIPSVRAKYVGLSLKLKLTVSAKGKPENVRLEKPLSSYSDIHKMTFASQLQNQVRSWRFEPALDTNGNAIAVKVIMPVQVIKKGAKNTVVASLVLDTPEADRT